MLEFPLREWFLVHHPVGDTDIAALHEAHLIQVDVFL
jgi:hypothetical protein